MTHLSLLFWLGLAIPGYAVLCHVSRAHLKSGLLGVAGLSYLATFAVLSPVSILAYLFHWPLAVFSGACVLVTLVGIVEIFRHGWWKYAWKLFVGALGVEVLMLVADGILGARVGAVLSGDAELHLARIRCLIDHGFSNRDPMLAGDYFFPIYHTNILHAVYAAGAQLTGFGYCAVWFASLPWAKLLIASGGYCLTWSIFRRRWAAWVVALFILTGQAPIPYVLYPNKLAPLWLMPILTGLAIEACRRSPRWTDGLKLAAGMIVLGQVHALYVIFAILTLGPLLAASGALRIVRRHPARLRAAACVLGLLPALLFPWYARAAPREPAPTATRRGANSGRTAAVASLPVDQSFIYLENGWMMKNPRTDLGGFQGWRGWLLLGGAVCALLGKRRRAVLPLIAVLLAAGICLYIPPVCTMLVRTFGATWMLSRLGLVLRIGFIVLMPGAVAFLLESVWSTWWLRSLLSIAVPFAALPFSHLPKPYDWPEYWRTAGQPSEARMLALRSSSMMRAFLRERVPPGQTILASRIFGPRVVMLHDCYLVAAPRGNNGVPPDELHRRRQNLKTLLAPGTSWEKRWQLLQRYNIRFVITGFMSDEWLRGHVRNTWRGPALRIVELDR